MCILKKEPVKNNQFVLLKGHTGNIFWTTDDGSNHEEEGFVVLYRGSTTSEMVAEWDKYHPNFLL